MNAGQWEAMVARWDEWYRETIADLRERAAAGETYAQHVLQRYDVLCVGQRGLRPVKPLKPRTALNRAMREIPKP